MAPEGSTLLVMFDTMSFSWKLLRFERVKTNCVCVLYYFSLSYYIQKERDRARAAAHHAKQSADSADIGSGQIAAETSEVATETSTGTPVLDVPPHPPPGLDGVGRRPSTRSTTVPVKIKLAAFARSAAEMALKETLPKFIPGFDQNIEFFMKECDFGDGEERRYFNKYTNMFVFGFHLDKDLVTPELLKQMKMKWVEKDKYWDHRPSEVIDIII